MPSVEQQAMDLAASKSPPVGASDLGGSLDAYLAKMSKDEGEMKTKMEPVIKDIESQKSPSPPVLAEMPKDTQEHSPLEAFGTPAMWIATLGSAFTRQPFVNSLKAATGVLNAARQNDMNEFSKQMESLKVHNENAEKTAKFELDTYKDAIDKDKALSSAYTSMFKNDTAAQFAGIKMQDEYVKTLQKQSEDAIKNMPYKMWEASMKAKNPDFTAEDFFANPAKYPDAVKAFMDMTKKGGGAQKEVGAISDEEYAKFDPRVLKTKGETILNGGTYADAGISMRSSNNPERAAVDRWLAENHPDFDRVQAEIGKAARGKEAGTVATRAGQLKIIGEFTKEMIPETKELADKVLGNNWRLLNSAYVETLRQSSDLDQAQLGENIYSLASAYARSLNPSGQVTDAGRDSAYANLSQSSSAEAFKATLDRMGHNIAKEQNIANKAMAGESFGEDKDTKKTETTKDFSHLWGGE